MTESAEVSDEILSRVLVGGNENELRTGAQETGDMPGTSRSVESTNIERGAVL